MLRKCTICGLQAYTKDALYLFVKHKKHKYGYKNICRKCKAEKSKEWYKANKEQALEKCREWYKDNREQALKTRLKWAKENPHKCNRITARYKAAKLQSTPIWADTEIINDFYLEAQYHQLEVDHIVPLQGNLVCGLHVEHNLQLLPKEKNVSKGNRHWPDQW